MTRSVRLHRGRVGPMARHHDRDCPQLAPVRRRGAAQRVLPLALAAALGALAAPSCKHEKPPPAGESAEGEEEIGPVYPVDGLPTLPVAARYCEVVRETPRRRRQACCP